MVGQSGFRRGDQVAYIPLHAGGDIEHPDVELGFVMDQSVDPDAVFVRYWRAGRPGSLRTVANSELTPVDCLRRHISVHQEFVAAAIHDILLERA